MIYALKETEEPKLDPMAQAARLAPLEMTGMAP
jgi:hypothetical protein